MTNFPDSVSGFTVEYLDEVLREASVIGDLNVTAIDAVALGHGKMGDNARISVQYGSSDTGTAPTSLVAKFPAQDERARAAASSGGSYAREVHFYQQLADRTDMTTPTVYRSELSSDGTSFLILMEDLAPAEPGNQLVGTSRPHTSTALSEATRLASAFRNDNSMLTLDFVQQPASDVAATMTEELLIQFWPGFLERFGHALSAECTAFGNRYVTSHAFWAQNHSGDFALSHGDFRSENILFGESGSATTVDWQTLAIGTLFTDIAYYCGGSLEIDDRRAWERELVEECRESFQQQGIDLSADESWDLYRQAAIHGLMISVLGASFSSPDPRGDAMFTVMIQRHLQHCVDLQCDSFLS